MFRVILALFSCLCLAAAAQRGQGGANDEMMKELQKILMQAEKDGKADKPMMFKNVDGKMVMEEIPQDILDTFEFPSGMMNDKEEM